MQYALDGALQLAVCIALLTLFWGIHVLFVRWRRTERTTWARWIGLHLPPRLRRRLWIFPVAFLSAWLLNFLQLVLVDDFASFASETVAYKVTRNFGADLLIAAVVYPFLSSALTEELFFRGFIAKRLIRHLGFHWGNVLQSVIFLAPHSLLILFFASGQTAMLHVFVVVTILPMAWLSGWAMERRDDGSIVTPWLIHSGANFGTMIYFWLWVPTTTVL